MPQRRNRVRFLHIGIRWTESECGRYVEAIDEKEYEDVLHVHLDLCYPATLRSTQRHSNYLNSVIGSRGPLAGQDNKIIDPAWGIFSGTRAAPAPRG
jgi:hypothetical protein